MAKAPVATGGGGAVSTVDADATRIGLDVLRRGGNAVDAAVCAAAALGVCEPYNAGIGGGGFFVYYDAWDAAVHTIDGRECAPRSIPRGAFIDPRTAKPYPFMPDLITSGVSVGVPGTLATWDRALRTWGSWSLREALEPAAGLAADGFEVDETFRTQTQANAERFAAIRPTAELFLPGGRPPAAGSVLRNPDLAGTYELIRERGVEVFYRGELAREIAGTVQAPPVRTGTRLPVPPGSLSPGDLAAYDVRTPQPARTSYRGFDIYGMAPPCSGAATVGEILNILERSDLSSMSAVDALHHYLEASALAFADREAYVGDGEPVPAALLSGDFGVRRARRIAPGRAARKPVPAGDPYESGEPVAVPALPATRGSGRGRSSTSHVSVADRWGNVVAYTLSNGHIGGSGITVPGRGFLLNNELTDFSLVYRPGDPNRLRPGGRPRSSMAPTIAFRQGRPWLTLGSPGGPTIVTTVTQTMLNRIDLGMSLSEALAAPRANPRNVDPVLAEGAFIEACGASLEKYGHRFTAPSDRGSFPNLLGAVTAIEFLPDGRMMAAAEPVRAGGGDAAVVEPHLR